MRLFLFFSCLFVGLQAQAGLVILQYHHVDESTPAITSVSPEVFRSHMQLLEDEGMTVVDLEDAMLNLLAGEPLPERAVAITFDDAYQSIFDHAWPELNARDWPFTVFVNTDAVDGRYSDMMDWDALRTLQKHGALIANHTRSHPYLLEVPAGTTAREWWENEINGAEKRIEEETGRSPKIFAYPYGEYTPELVNWLKSEGYIAFGQQSGAVGATSHPQVIPRFPASGAYADTNTLKTKLHSLPFAIQPEDSADPILTGKAPGLTLHIPVQDFLPRQLACYAAGVGKLALQTEEDNGIVEVTMQQDSPVRSGRSRYNCTAPSLSQPGRYYWYSQLWINTDIKNR